MLLVMMSTTSRHLFRWQPTRVTMVRAFTTRTFIHAYSTRQFASFPSSLTTGTTIASNRPRRQCFFSVLSSYGEPGDQRDPSPSVSFHNDGTDRASPIDLEDYWQEEHGLNKAQTEAVTQPVYHAVTRVVAGPGSGKTKVLTCRIAHLLQQTSNTRDRILAVTFTRKAAGEMQQRLEALLQADNDADVEQEDGPPSDGNTSESSVHPALYRVTLGTFHSVCAKILRWNGDLLATLPTVAQVMQSSPNATTLDGGFIIVDQGEQLRMLKECLTEANIDLNQFKDIRPFTVLSAISNAKSIYARGKNPFQPEANQKRLPPLKEIASKVFPRYVQKLHSTNCLDFDDLILMARELLTTQPEVRERLQRRWQHVLIDEFQDTSRTQMDLVKLLTSDSLFVVGDADQSIYSWRGAHVGSLQDLDQDFSNVNTVYLMENYRSTSNIVKAAQKIISSSSSANLRQDMKPKRGSGPAPRVIACGDDKEEAEFVIRGIKEKLSVGEYTDHHEVALIYRTNAQSRVLEEACVQHNLPYVQFGSATSFYKRQEIKDTLCFLRWLYNGMDRGSMLRAFKTPAKGIGEKAIIEFDEYCGLVVNYVQKYRPGLNRPNPLDILLSLLEENEALWGPEAPLPTDTISTRPLKLFKTFAQQMKELRDKAYTEPLDKVINHVVPHFGLFPHLDKISKTTAEYEERRANVRELQSAAQKYAAQGPCLIDPKSTVHTEVELESPLGNYLDDVALVTDMADQGRESQDKRFKVCLMTIHASKGMEFDTVYVVGNEDGTFPTSQSITEGEGSVVLEEEKRLCYVAMTRAKTELILTWRKEVPIFTNAGIKRVEKKRSRFLNVLVSKNDKGARNSKRTSPPKKAKKKTAQPSMVGTNSIFSRKNDEKQFNDRGSSMNNMRRSVSSSARHSRPETARHSTLPSKSSYAAPKRSTSRHREEREPPGRQETRRNGTRSVFSQRNPGTTKGTASSPGRTTNLPPLQSSRQPPSLHQTTATSSAIPKQPEMDSTWFFPVGSKVKHTKFGQGIVLPPPPPRSKGDMPVVVEFPDGARREFSAHGTDLSPIFS